MKVEQKRVIPAFDPVTITLETLEEAIYVREMFGCTSNTKDTQFGVKSEGMYQAYNKLCTATDNVASPAKYSSTVTPKGE